MPARAHATLHAGCRRGRPRSPGQRVGAHLAGTDPHHTVDLAYPELPVADLPRPRRFHDRVDDALDVAVVDDHLDLDLRHEVHLVLRAAVDLAVSPLAADPF